MILLQKYFKMVKMVTRHDSQSSISMSSDDTDLHRVTMNEDELINFLGQVEFSLYLTL